MLKQVQHDKKTKRHSELVSESNFDKRRYFKNFVIAVLDTAIFPNGRENIMKFSKYNLLF